MGELVFPPEDRFEYGNPGYEVPALVVERVSGVTFGQFLEAQIFDPSSHWQVRAQDGRVGR